MMSPTVTFGHAELSSKSSNPVVIFAKELVATWGSKYPKTAATPNKLVVVRTPR